MFCDIPDIAHVCRKPCNLRRNHYIVLSMQTTLANHIKWNMSQHKEQKSFFQEREREEKKGWQEWSVITCSLIPCGLVARIRRSHRRGRGSIPRTGVCLAIIKENKKHTCFFYCCLPNPFLKHARFITSISCLHIGQKPCQASFYHTRTNVDLPST